MPHGRSRWRCRALALYSLSVRPPFLSRRLVTGCLIAIASITHPGEGLAHGVAHHREHAPEADHPADTGHDLGSLRISSADHEQDHAHANVDDASVRSRIDVQATVAEVDLPCVAVRDVAADLPSDRVPRTRGDPSTGPPPRLRAPPTS